MPVVPVIVKAFFAFCNCNEVIIATGSTNIEEICPSFTCFYPLAEQALVVAIITVIAKIFVFVRHNPLFLVNDLTWAKLIKKAKYPN
jgi:hypothetical protein